MSLPRVMVGCAVRDREWSVERWLGALVGLDYPHELLSLAVLVNDSRDRTLEACAWWAEEALRAGFRRAHVAQCDFGTTVDNNLRDQRDYLAFARARDAWLGLREDEPLLFPVDSDVEVAPDTLTRLVELQQQHDLAMLAAVVDNSDGAGFILDTNVLNLVDGRYWHVMDVRADRSRGVKPCDLTGACVLLRADAIAGLSYAEGDVSGGEDVPFCEALRARGHRPHYAPSVRAMHWQRTPTVLDHLSRPDWHARLAAYHGWMQSLCECDRLPERRYG